MSCTIANKEGRFLRVGYEAGFSESEIKLLESQLSSQELLEECVQSEQEISELVACIKELIEVIQKLDKVQRNVWNQNRHQLENWYRWTIQGSFCNESEKIERTVLEVKSEIDGVLMWHERVKKNAAVWIFLKKAAKIEKDRIPSMAKIKKIKEEWRIEEYSDAKAAEPGYGWAIWMGSARNLGYMDDKKRAAGAGSARLFESEAAALKTAKSARFGDEGSERGPCAVVKMFIEPIEVLNENGVNSAIIQEVIKRKEAMELREALEYGNVEGIQAALEDLEIPDVKLRNALAGQEEGLAFWVKNNYYGQDGDEGFLNYRNQVGPLNGATIHKLNSKKEVYYDGAIKVRVRIRPVEIGTKIGEPDVKDVEQAIEFEQSQIDYEVLKRQTKETLKEAMQQRSEKSTASAERVRSRRL